MIVAALEPARERLLTVADYHRMAETGILGPEERIVDMENERLIAHREPDEGGCAREIGQGSPKRLEPLPFPDATPCASDLFVAD